MEKWSSWHEHGQPMEQIRVFVLHVRLWCSSLSITTPEIVSMIRKYHNHKLQTNPWHCNEEPHNNHGTPGRRTKQSNQLSFPHQDDYKTGKDM